MAWQAGDGESECPSIAMAHLQAVLPSALNWRAKTDDILAHMPEGLVQVRHPPS